MYRDGERKSPLLGTKKRCFKFSQKLFLRFFREFYCLLHELKIHNTSQPCPNGILVTRAGCPWYVSRERWIWSFGVEVNSISCLWRSEYSYTKSTNLASCTPSGHLRFSTIVSKSFLYWAESNKSSAAKEGLSNTGEWYGCIPVCSANSLPTLSPEMGKIVRVEIRQFANVRCLVPAALFPIWSMVLNTPSGQIPSWSADETQISSLCAGVNARKISALTWVTNSGVQTPSSSHASRIRSRSADSKILTVLCGAGLFVPFVGPFIW